MGQQYSKSTRHKFSNYMYEYFIGHRQTGHKPGRRRRRRIKRLHNGTAFVNAGSATCPTAPISQPGGDSREPPPSMAGSPTPAVHIYKYQLTFTLRMGLADKNMLALSSEWDTTIGSFKCRDSIFDCVSAGADAVNAIKGASVNDLRPHCTFY